MGKISFGTDGWRAIISEDFTFDNVKIVAQSMADYIMIQKSETENPKSKMFGRKMSVIVGYDTRFMSEKYAELIARVMAGNGIQVVLSDRPTPTPSVSYAIRLKNFIGGIMVTASHNPAYYNGIKYKGYFGGSVGKDVTNYMEERLYKSNVSIIDKDSAISKGLITYENFVAHHVKEMKKFVNMKLLKKTKLKILVDSMNGTGGHYLEDILKGTSNKVATINGNRDAYFNGRPPEPNEVHLKSTAAAVKKGKFDIGIVTDGDADRLGIILPDGEVLSGHKVMSLLVLHLIEDRKVRGGVVQTICGTVLIDKIARKYGLRTYETPVGFKYICDIFLNEDILAGGEETGGVAFKGWLPERDGITSGLLILEMVAGRKKSIKKIVEDIKKTYGNFVYKRIDLAFPQDKKEKLLGSLKDKKMETILGKKVVDVKTLDGYKFILEDSSWMMLRASGTEPKLRIYSEGSSEKEALKLAEFGRDYAQSI